MSDVFYKFTRGIGTFYKGKGEHSVNSLEEICEYHIEKDIKQSAEISSLEKQLAEQIGITEGLGREVGELKEKLKKENWLYKDAQKNEYYYLKEVKELRKFKKEALGVIGDLYEEAYCDTDGCGEGCKMCLAISAAEEILEKHKEVKSE